MNEYTVGDKVRVRSLTSTRVQYGLNSHMKVGQELTIKAISENIDDGYQMENNWWYVAADLELLDKPAITAIPLARVLLTLQDVEVGDTVRIVSLEDTEDEFGTPQLDIGDTFVIDDTDDEDDSVQDVKYMDWFSLKDLTLVEKQPDPRDEVDENDERPETDEDLEFLDDIDTVVERDINFIINKDSVTLMIDGDSEVATKDHKNFVAIRQFVIDEEYDEAMSLMNISIGIKAWGMGSLQIVDGKILYNGMDLTGKLVDRIIEQMIGGNEDFEKFAKFLNLTMEHEDNTTRSRLMDFAAHDKLDINEDGHVVAFKNVREDYFDKHSRKFRNMIGDQPSMRRSDCDADHTKACSRGLHVCSPTYLKGFWGTSGRTMRVVVDPRDFVGIPYDYKDSKARVCKYTVVEDVSDQLSKYLT